MKKSTFVILSAFAALIPLNLAHSASFDCTKAQSWAEKTICTNSELSALDDSLAKKYRAQLESPEENKDSVREEQLQWLKFQRNTCRDEACLIQEYQERIDENPILGTAWGYPIDFKPAELPTRQAFGNFYATDDISFYDPVTEKTEQDSVDNHISIYSIPDKPYLAIVDSELAFTNLHSCTISDHLAFWSKNHWVLNTEYGGETYELRLYPATQKNKTQLLIRDIDNQYRELYCGMHGYFDGIILESK